MIQPLTYKQTNKQQQKPQHMKAILEEKDSTRFTEKFNQIKEKKIQSD